MAGAMGFAAGVLCLAPLPSPSVFVLVLFNGVGALALAVVALEGEVTRVLA
jgi:hypothetical protein